MEKMQLVQKAYEIDLDKLDEGYLTDTIMCHADSLNKAKTQLLKQVQYDGWRLKYSDEELTYLNIPVKRRKSADKVMFEGKEVKRWQIRDIEIDRIRTAQLDEILNNPHIQYCYIIKGDYYRPNACGYTSFKHNAGIFTKEEAVSHAKAVREIRLERIDIEEHNKMIQDKINELQRQLIQANTK